MEQITEEQAKEKLEGWISQIKLRKAARRRLADNEKDLLEYIMDGDLYVDAENNMVLRLLTPLKLNDGTEMTELTLIYKSYTLDELSNIGRRANKDEFNSVRELILTYAKGINSVIEIGRLDSQDFSLVSTIMLFFSAK